MNIGKTLGILIVVITFVLSPLSFGMETQSDFTQELAKVTCIKEDVNKYTVIKVINTEKSLSAETQQTVCEAVFNAMDSS